MPKQTLVTGGTGMVGHFIVQSLLRRGHRVRALVRSLDKGRRLLPDCELVEGDVTAPASLDPAVAGCEWVFHAAGFPEQWMKDHRTFERINADGTANMVAASRAAGVARFMFTSTIDVFTWRPGADYDESELDPDPKNTHYERSKQRADRIVAEAVASGMDAVFLHPSAVYGPAPSDSPGVNELIVRLWNNKVPGLLPGGFPVVFAPDAGEGHVLAAERAQPGARFILSERYHSLTDQARAMLVALGIDRTLPRVLPLWLASLVSTIGELKAGITGTPPLIPKGQLKFLQVDSYPVANRATTELGLAFTPFADGLAKTVEWLRATERLAKR
ncbi:MAG: NAD-dependent epimerase/dehydratase family protein [Deltaproteobacteria bacterium]|nr:NAD-dependent epimerase/dehydratase family protein [Deltaproteobacteria bacterium]